MNNFRRILKQKCDSRSRMRRVNTHNIFQTPRTIRTGVMSRIVSGTNKTTKKFFFSSNFLLKFWWSAPHEGVTMHKKFQPSRTPRTQVTGRQNQQQTHTHTHTHTYEILQTNQGKAPVAEALKNIGTWDHVHAETTGRQQR